MGFEYGDRFARQAAADVTGIVDYLAGDLANPTAAASFKKSLDVYKRQILSSMVCGHQIYPQNIPNRGIRAITIGDVKAALRMGCVIKLIAWMKLSKDGSVAAGVEPCRVPRANQLASVDDVFNAVLVKGDMLGRCV